LVGPARGVLPTDTDVDRHPRTTPLPSTTLFRSLALNPDGSFSYTPTANYNGADNFTYRAIDGHVASDVATVALTITPVNDAPVAHDDAYQSAEDTPLTIGAPGAVLDNDTDADGD